MQNRLYTVIEKSFFSDPDGILVAAFDYLEISGEIDEKSFEKLKGCFPCAVFDGKEGMGDIKSIAFALRDGRRDRATEELKSAVKVMKLDGVNVGGGREFYFNGNATAEQIDAFILDNVSPYVYVSDLCAEYSEASDEDAIKGFCMADYTALTAICKEFNLKMEIDDLMCVQNYFISESREPTLTEIKIIDNFFAENFRHTTFETILDRLETADPAIKSAWDKYREIRGGKTPSLADITGAAPSKFKGEEIVSASEKLNGIKLDTADENEEFLLVPKCESHNRSTEAAPYDGAAGCIGGAAKDLLCAFGYPYDSYRTVGYGQTEKSRKKAIFSSLGYAENSYTAGIPYSKCLESVSSIYNEKCRESCIALAISNGKSVKKSLSKKPQAGDKIYILGTKTASDGKNCSRSNLKAKDSVGEYVPTSDGGTLRALIRLFVRPDFADIAVAINDVSSGGIICALGEISDGANIYVSDICTYYGIPFADAILSEGNERMVVIVRRESAASLEEISKKEGVGCCKIGEINDTKRFVLYNGENKKIASLTSAFLFSGGAEKHLVAYADEEPALPASEALEAAKAPYNAANPFKKLIGKGFKYDFERACLISASDIRGMKCDVSNRLDRVGGGDFDEFDALAGEYEPSVRKLRYKGRTVQGKNGDLYSALCCSYLPDISKNAPFKGAYLSVIGSVIKLIAAGYVEEKTYLALQEYFPRHKNISRRLGISVSAMLGCFEAQMQLGIPSICGRISVGDGEGESDGLSSITSYAFCVSDKATGIGKAFRGSGNKVVLVSSEFERNGMPDARAVEFLKDTVRQLKSNGALVSASAVSAQNACTVIMEMCRPYKKGVCFDDSASIDDIFDTLYGAIICEIKADADIPRGCALLGYVSDECSLTRDGEAFPLSEFFGVTEEPQSYSDGKRYLYLKEIKDGYGTVRPVDEKKIRVLMPVTKFSVPSDAVVTKFKELGAKVSVYPCFDVNITDFVKKLRATDILWLTDGLGNEGLLNTVLMDKRVAAELEALRERGGLIYGCGSSFDTLIKTGLLELDDRVGFANTSDAVCGRYVKINVTSNLSAFTRHMEIGKHYKGYVHGKRLMLRCPLEYADELAKDGRIVTQYDIGYNRTGSDVSIDSICSRDGTVLGQISLPQTHRECIDTVTNAIKYFSVL